VNNFLGAAALIGIYAALVFDIFSTTNSSPQTTQMFAIDRAATLWRWVRIGAIIAVIFVALGAYLESRDSKNYWAPIAGGALALGIMWYLYSIALRDGGGTRPGSNVTRMVTDW
jgi:hypothetical protein